ncbi:V-type ATP synthase subunit B [Cuniculiplasma sp. SKW4]|uniref:V-type ATP synthase subunit B n=1 Tax=Cuniculiplasma sp. SKW4 TaxID=3400171 RepID=UPI003FD652F6
MVKVGYKSIREISGPLIFVEGIKNAGYNEMVSIETPDGQVKSGQVLDTSNGLAIVQVFGATSGLDNTNTVVKFRGETARIRVSDEVLGRVFNGLGEPIDKGPEIQSSEKVEIVGDAINPYSREEPSEFIQTGISTIDGMNTLVRGQKLPIFSASGLPHNMLAAQIARQAKTLKSDDQFAVIFGAMGITSEEANFFMNEFRKTGSLNRAAIFLNLSSDPSMERIILPRVALTTAEYLAYEREYHVLVILTDMTNYCESLREISSAREEVPGRRGFPGYMYTDLSTIYERAGKIRGKNGSITQIPILTMPGDDITNPIPDLTGYITEGQIVMSRDLQRKGIYPPVDVLPSLSRLMNQGIGKGSTREDHRGVADQLYSAYANGKDLRSLSAIVGEESLSANDKSYLKFADEFEKRYVNQGLYEDRNIEDTLNLSYDLMSELPVGEMKRLKKDFIEKYGKWK